ncbi:MAG: SanA/YdcF family protein [Crocinitomicaceae bacterium]
MRKITTYFYLLLSFILMILSSSYIIEEKTESQVYDNINEIPSREYGLVLGTSKNGKYGLNPYFVYRMNATVELFRAGKISKVIVSGDNHTIGYNEPLDMRNYLIKHGIPEDKIILDYAGFHTLDSVVRSKLVFNLKEVTIISQKFHNQRALYIANHREIDAIAFNAMDTGYGNYTHIREYLARFLCLLDLHLFYSQPKFL